MSVARIAVVDYGMGNLRSVSKALERVGGTIELTRERDRIRAADAIVLPGVGAFPRAIEAMRAFALDELIRERLEAGTPTLGICLGMQLLFERSSELGGAFGLGALTGAVDTLDATGLKLPQIGWNSVAWRRPSALTDGLPQPCAFYHVHSFAAVGVSPEDVIGTARYGSEFVTAVERGRIYGVQFHPEKSGAHGLRLLENFVAIAGGASARTAGAALGRVA